MERTREAKNLSTDGPRRYPIWEKYAIGQDANIKGTSPTDQLDTPYWWFDYNRTGATKESTERWLLTISEPLTASEYKQSGVVGWSPESRT